MRIAFSLIWAALLLCLTSLAHPSTAFGQFGEPAVKTRVAAEHPQAARGGRLVVAVELNHDEGFHTWPSAQTELPEEVAGFAIRTEVGLLGPAWVALDGVQYPPTHPDLVANPTGGPPIRAPLFSGRAVAFARLHIAPDAPLGNQVLRIAVNFQACDATNCQFPEEQVHEVRITIVADGTPQGEPNEPALFASFDAGAWGTAPDFASANAGNTGASTQPAADQQPAPASTLLGFKLGSNIAVLALAAAIGGLVLNLTPCVLPVIPIKVMTLTQHAASRRHAIVLGLWMALGVVAFWAAIGLPMALVSRLLDPSQLIFGIWWVCMAVGLVVALLGLGIMGLFTFNLPQSVYLIETKADSPFGSFLFGVLAAVLGLPCFGFVAAGLLAPSLTMPATHILAIFIGIGVGMAAPYLVLSAYPQLLKFIPRTGPASELVKQVMGILLLAAAAFFIAASIDVLLSEYPYLAGSMTWWSAGFFIAIAGLWMTIRTFQITRRAVPRIVFPLLAVGMTLGIGVFANDRLRSDRESYLARQEALASVGALSEVPAGVWLLYTPELLATVRESGRPVFLDFTASWCVNCKALKAAVLDPMKGVFKARGVVLLEVDCSFRTSPGSRLLADLGRTGVPQWALYAPGAERPTFIEFTPQSVLNALDAAGVPKAEEPVRSASTRP